MTHADWLINILRCPETGQRFSPHKQGLIRSDGKIFADRDAILSLVYPTTLVGPDAKMNRLYERIAPFYDLSERALGWILTGINMQRGREKIVSLLNLSPGQRLLEVSPGPGVFQPMLRRALGNDAEMVALDLSHNMLRQCRKRHADLNIELVQGNGQYLPFADESFDALFHFGGINLFNDADKALKEFIRVVRKGGTVAWGDELMSDNFRHPLGRRILPRMNPGFLKSPPQIPDMLVDVQTYEVYQGLGYLTIARR